MLNCKGAVALIAVLLAIGLPVEQAAAERCGNRVVSVGDHQYEVRARCGDPHYADTRVVYPYEFRGEEGVRATPLLDIPVVIEEWIYEPGSGQFPRLFRFQNGRLIDIEGLNKSN